MRGPAGGSGRATVRGVALPDLLRAAQKAFDETGGLHAAALFSSRGELIAIREDVGRHNAIDKLVGSQVLEGALPLHDRILMVSGRVSFEIVQKAAVAGVPIVAAVSAPSDLAVETAERLGVTLVGFLRGDRFNVYSHDRRIDLRDLTGWGDGHRFVGRRCPSAGAAHPMPSQRVCLSDCNRGLKESRGAPRRLMRDWEAQPSVQDRATTMVEVH